MLGAVIVKFKTPSTVTLWDELPPSPVHVRVNVLLPFFLIFIVSEPDSVLDPSQSPLAEQLDAFEEDQVSVMSWLTSDELLDEDRLIIGAGYVGWVGSLLPPPPPQDEIKRIIKAKYEKLVNLYWCVCDPYVKKTVLLIYIECKK